MPETLHLVRAGWDIVFDPEQQELACKHRDTPARLVGSLSFTVGEETWRIVPGRDACPERLALCAPDGNVQGYITFSGTDRQLLICVIHRTAQAYAGKLLLQGTATLGNSTFACRTRAPQTVRVVQMRSGPADSALNESLFDVDTDAILRFSALSVRIESTEHDGFNVRLTAAPERAAAAAIRLEVIPDAYRSRYAPYYRPLDRTRAPGAPTGWMSWNVYFDTAGAEENLAEARIAAEHLKPFGLDIWSIESWQANSDTLPVRNFHNLDLKCHPGQFPEGMKKLAEDIRKLGFRPGIWTAPFGTGNETFYNEHKDWFLHDENGKPFSNWCGRFVLDPSQPDVRNHIRDMHRTMAREWGYEFFKIDGMSGRHHSYSAHFYERPEVRRAFKHDCPNAFELCVRALREGIGPDSVFLACQGHYTGPDVEVADAGRIGGDIVSPNKPSTWHNILSQSKATLNQLFVHNILWYNDPDTLLVGDFHALEQARVTTTIVGLPGQLMFAGDKLGDLGPERMRLLKQVLPVCDVRPLDLFPVFDLAPVWDLKIRREFAAWDVVALFNWHDEDIVLRVTFEELGLDPDERYVLHEFWEGKICDVLRDDFGVDIPARSTRLVSIHPYLGRPQFVGTDRHITQGGVSLRQLQWNPDTGILSGTVDCVPGHPVNMTLFVPADYAVAAATADVPVDLDPEEGTWDGFLTVTLSPTAADTAWWQITFTNR